MSESHREHSPYLNYLIATLMSVALLAYQATIPFKLKALGGGLDSVGFLFTWTSFWYTVAGVALGWISQRIGPRRVMLGTLASAATMALLIPATTAIWQVYVVATIYLVSLCLFWIAMEHASTGLHLHLSLIQSTAAFCVAFSLGNTIGQMISSLLVSFTLVVPFMVATGMLGVVAGLVTWTVSPEAGFRRSTAADVAAFSDADRQRVRRSLLASRTGLVATYGMYALVSLFLPRYLWEHRGFSKPLAGTLTAVMLLTMAITFAGYGRRSDWPHRLGWVRACPFLAAGCVLIVGLATQVAVIAVGSILLGAVAATAYVHNLYYSLEEPGQRARNAGLHEAIVGVAFMIPPALGGVAARLIHTPESIFWTGAGFAVLAGLAQNFALARRPTPTSTVPLP